MILAQVRDSAPTVLLLDAIDGPARRAAEIALPRSVVLLSVRRPRMSLRRFRYPSARGSYGTGVSDSTRGH